MRVRDKAQQRVYKNKSIRLYRSAWIYQVNQILNAFVHASKLLKAHNAVVIYVSNERAIDRFLANVNRLDLAEGFQKAIAGRIKFIVKTDFQQNTLGTPEWMVLPEIDVYGANFPLLKAWKFDPVFMRKGKGL